MNINISPFERSQPPLLLSLQIQMRTLQQQIVDLQESHAQVLTEVNKLHARQTIFERDTNSHIEQRLAGFERILQQHLHSRKSQAEFQESLDTDTGKPVLQTEPRGAANVAKEECLQTTTMPLKLLRSGGLISAQSDLHYPNDSDLGGSFSTVVHSGGSRFQPAASLRAQPYSLDPSRHAQLCHQADSTSEKDRLQRVENNETDLSSQVWRSDQGDLVAICRRCGMRFNVNSNGKYQCAFHAGRLDPSTNRYTCCDVMRIESSMSQPVYCTFKPHLA